MSEVRGVVAAHASFAEGLVSAVQAITGRGDLLRSLSNAGRSLADVIAALTALLDETRAHVVFTDLPAGSCTLAARRLQRDRPDLAVVVGVNLPMLLEFVMRDTSTSADLDTAVERGREHIRRLDGAHVR